MAREKYSQQAEIQTACESLCVINIPQEPHLLVFLLILADDLGCGHAHLHAIDDKLPGSLQGLTREVLRGVEEQGQVHSNLRYETSLRLVTVFAETQRYNESGGQEITLVVLSVLIWRHFQRTTVLAVALLNSKLLFVYKMLQLNKYSSNFTPTEFLLNFLHQPLTPLLQHEVTRVTSSDNITELPQGHRRLNFWSYNSRLLPVTCKQTSMCEVCGALCLQDLWFPNKKKNKKIHAASYI